MKKILAVALTLAVVSGCASETDTPVEEPVLGEAEAVTEVEDGPADDSLIVPADSLDPTYVPEEESMESEMTEGEMLEPEGE